MKWIIRPLPATITTERINGEEVYTATLTVTWKSPLPGLFPTQERFRSAAERHLSNTLYSEVIVALLAINNAIQDTSLDQEEIRAALAEEIPQLVRDLAGKVTI